MKVKTKTWGTIEANEEMLEEIAMAFEEAAVNLTELGNKNLATLSRQTARDITDELEKGGWYD